MQMKPGSWIEWRQDGERNASRSVSVLQLLSQRVKASQGVNPITLLGFTANLQLLQVSSLAKCTFCCLLSSDFHYT